LYWVVLAGIALDGNLAFGVVALGSYGLALGGNLIFGTIALPRLVDAHPNVIVLVFAPTMRLILGMSTLAFAAYIGLKAIQLWGSA
jgi:hypothetical protein